MLMAPDTAILKQPNPVVRTSSTFSGAGKSEWVEHVLMRSGLGVQFKPGSVCEINFDARKSLRLRMGWNFSRQRSTPGVCAPVRAGVRVCVSACLRLCECACVNVRVCYVRVRL
jgi:hypothetical protein